MQLRTHSSLIDNLTGVPRTLLVPLVAHWLDMSYWHALITDLGLLLFFLVYTMVFTWVFDRVFGLPASAQPTPAS